MDDIPVSETEFRLFQGLIYRESGIFLSAAKKELLVARLRKRLRHLQLRSFSSYFRLLKNDSEEQVRMLDCICTNETRFFRGRSHFEFLEQRIFPLWKSAKTSPRHPPSGTAAGQHHTRRIRVWSAGCSSGEEPYSLAMLLLDHFPGWPIEILATDLSTRVLERARTAVWSLEKAKNIPRGYLERFMLKGTRSQQGKMAAGPEIRAAVRFHRLNLNDEALSLGGSFDLIFCRNVLIYFDSESRTKAIRRILRHLAPNGYLFLGHAESLNGMAVGARAVAPTVYTVEGRIPCSAARTTAAA